MRIAVCILAKETDLIYEGIATPYLGAARSLACVKETDLIYEGIATHFIDLEIVIVELKRN